MSSVFLEATKKLVMKYESPPVPVNLSKSGPLDLSGIFRDEDDEPEGDAVHWATVKEYQQKIYRRRPTVLRLGRSRSDAIVSLYFRLMTLY